MVNYYDILKVSPKASTTEIKSAYRRLARKLHPDKNNGSEETALKFAAIAEAYEVLGNAKERVNYDRRLLEQQYSGSGSSDGTFSSTNRHVQRWRRMVYEKRYNDIIDRMIAEERLEAMAFQRAIYPTVALYVSAVLSTALKPMIFISTGVVGQIIIVSLFIVGLIHISGRVKEGFVRYTEVDDNIHDSILDGNEVKAKPFSRILAAGTLIGGFIFCLGIGYLIGTQTSFMAKVLPEMFSKDFEPEFFLYPPIVTFFVDVMHTLALRFEK
ncbi:MAG: DnaJ domain-containing protein [Pyrinomonadaceae bacterium]|nr:DnaJ domain-containing protein [Pyrinomonadaceae bacterium]